jgi:hypothetical protein
MLRKFKENLFKWWISVNTGRLVTRTGWYYSHRRNLAYMSTRQGVRTVTGKPLPFFTDKAPETKEEFVNAVYKHLTDGTTN